MTHRADLHTRLSYALAWIRGQLEAQPAAGIVLGSGLAGFADRLQKATVIPYAGIPGFPVSRVPGHPGRLVVGELPRARPEDGPPLVVAALQGRVHAYEGWSGEEIAFGAIRAEVIHTPGHTPGSICLQFGLPAERSVHDPESLPRLYAGDTLFCGSIGRTDLPGGDTEAILRSIRERLLSLPDETIVIPGHGPLTAIGRERRMNPFLQ